MPKIEGPYSFKGADGLKMPAYIFKPGGERKDIGEVTVKVDGGMTFEVKLDEEYKDIETASFDVPMRYTYLNVPDKPQINWRHNCLTPGSHDGRQETIWKLPLVQAMHMFTMDELKELVTLRIYNDAMQIVEHGESDDATSEWADRTKELAEEKFPDVFQTKINEITEYYNSSSWRGDVKFGIERVKKGNLNPHYQPLHPHDTINMLCRIIGASSSIKAAREVG